MLAPCCRPAGTRRFQDAAARLRKRRAPTFNAAKVDPTGTNAIRVRWQRELERRFGKIRTLIRSVVNTSDVFGLRDKVSDADGVTASLRRMVTAVDHRLGFADADPLQLGAFAFSRSKDKVDAFMQWLTQMEDQQIFSVVTGATNQFASETAWQNLYIDTVYRQAMRDAGAAIGVSPPAGIIQLAFNQPIHVDAIGLLYSRAFNELAGITDAMDQGIGRVLANGLANGDGPMQIARDMIDQVDGIGIARARVLARTETINAYAEASLNTYEDAGVEDVTADVEFSTAGDKQVCPICSDLEGKVYTIDEARGIIPVHPNCRCSWIPVPR